MTEDDRRALGVKMFKEVYGDNVPLPSGWENIGLMTSMMDTCFAEAWGKSTLPVRDQRLIIIGMLAALGETMPYIVQMKCALEKGELTAEQVKHIPVLLSQYIGFPRTSRIFQALMEAKIPV